MTAFTEAFRAGIGRIGNEKMAAVQTDPLAFSSSLPAVRLRLAKLLARAIAVQSMNLRAG